MVSTRRILVAIGSLLSLHVAAADEPVAAPTASEPAAVEQPATEPPGEPAAVEAPVADAPAAPEEDPRTVDAPATSVKFRPGEGLEIASAKKRWLLKISARLQLQYALEGVPVEDEDAADWSHAFQVRRARVVLAGNAFDVHTKYKFELAFAPRDIDLKDGKVGRSPLLDGYLSFEHLRDLSVRAGQFKVPYNHERVVSSADLQLVDRSLLNSEFTLDRDLGVMLYSKDAGGLGLLRWYAGVFTGEGHSSYDFTDFGMLYVGRLEIFPMGIWDGYDEQGDLAREEKARLGIGLAYAYVDEAHRERGTTGDVPPDGGTTDTHDVTGEVILHVRGFSFYGAVAWRDGVRHGGDAVDPLGEPVPVTSPRDGFGYNLQAGYLVPRIPFEIAARYGQVIPLGDEDDTSLEDESELGGGLSWYIAKMHAYKLQADWFHRWGADGIAHGEDQMRVQVQVTL